MASLRAEHTGAHIALFRSGSSPALLIQRAAPDHRPYIHPILSPDGVGELTENEPGHHLWQHGLYVGLNDVNGVGFWTEGLNNSKEHDGTFHPKPLAPPTVTGSQARWDVVTEWRSPGGQPMLTETQQWKFADRGDTFVLDLEWRLRAAIDLRFGKYSYGGLFLRMPWRANTEAELLTSEGAALPREAEGKRARWIALSLPVPGRAAGPAGMAMFDHPLNPEYPAPWRVDDNYGVAPSRCIAGEWNLAREAATVSRYRVFVYKGGIDRKAVDAQWQQFAASAKGNE